MKTFILIAVLFWSTQEVVAQTENNSIQMESKTEALETELMMDQDTITVVDSTALGASQERSHENPISEKEKREARIVGGVVVFLAGGFGLVVYTVKKALEELNRQVTEGIKNMNG